MRLVDPKHLIVRFIMALVVASALGILRGLAFPASVAALSPDGDGAPAPSGVYETGRAAIKTAVTK